MSDHRFPIEITETLVRLYVFLAQSLERCLDETQRAAYPERDHQAFLADARGKLAHILSSNPVVQGKVEDECRRVLALAARYQADGAHPDGLLDELHAERAVLKTKLLALSDLLAVFRAL